VFIVKKELMNSPFYGWYARKAGMIAAVRGNMSAIASIKLLIARVKASLAEQRQVVIFPEGTRVDVGKRIPFHHGIAALYSAADVPLVPVALNSGLFWGRRCYLKRPGRIVLQFLPPIEPGLTRKAVLHNLENRISVATADLEREAKS